MGSNHLPPLGPPCPKSFSEAARGHARGCRWHRSGWVQGPVARRREKTTLLLLLVGERSATPTSGFADLALAADATAAARRRRLPRPQQRGRQAGWLQKRRQQQQRQPQPQQRCQGAAAGALDPSCLASRSSEIHLLSWQWKSVLAGAAKHLSLVLCGWSSWAQSSLDWDSTWQHLDGDQHALPRSSPEGRAGPPASRPGLMRSR
mmetsp:Transcript_20028/g.43585  ORF Transcript_20028/g.43585 Transcript_20028/m.43585 type:complete len:205 (-) Transcript_20028:595-1209(-)